MISPLIDEILRSAVECRASDVILHAGAEPVFRVSGELHPVEGHQPSEEDLLALWTACGADPSSADHDASLTTGDGIRFRVNLFRQLGERGGVLRRIQREIPDMETLGLPCDLLREWAGRRSGVVLISGPTGSGKSTTLAAILEWINASAARHVVTIEDPVEFLFTSKNSFFTQREVGIDTASFAEGLRRSLRQNPDVILLGEIRDQASAATAIQASETGHLVLATLHAASCADVVERLQLLFPPDERESIRKTLSVQLLGVLCQRLVPAADGGLALLAEFFSNIGSSRKLIAEGRMPDLADFIARGDPKAARCFADSLLALVRAGRVAEAVAMDISDNPQELQRALRGITSSTQSIRR